MLKDFQIKEHADGSMVIGLDMNDRPCTEMQFLIDPETLTEMIRAAARAPEVSPRVSVGDVHATQRADGVRIEHNRGWFDLPWRSICKRLFE